MLHIDFEPQGVLCEKVLVATLHQIICFRFASSTDDDPREMECTKCKAVGTWLITEQLTKVAE